MSMCTALLLTMLIQFKLKISSVHFPVFNHSKGGISKKFNPYQYVSSKLFFQYTLTGGVTNDFQTINSVYCFC